MNCPTCGSPCDGQKFCAKCGTPINPYPTPPAPPTPPVVPIAPPAPPVPQPVIVTNPTIPPEYAPISPWAYWGLSLLFSIPIVGFVFLIIFSCSNGNLNRRNYARSYFCSLLIAAIIFLIYIVIMAIIGASAFAFIENMG